MARRRNQSGGLGPEDYQRMIGGFLKLDRRVQGLIVAVVVVVAIIAAVVYWRSHGPQPRPTATTLPSVAADNLLLGNPSGATSDPANRDNYLMVKPYYVLSYNDGNGTPNWVSWRVSRSDLGDAPRKPQFDPDDTLPAGFKKIAHRDYSGGGFDRGHLCPHADRAATQEMAWSTFVMTNIIPQAPNVNQKAWEHLESYCRGLARRGQHLYIMAGPMGKGGTGSSGLKQTIANGKVTVPAECWKIVVVVPESGSSDDLGKINSDTRVIAVVMPNDNNRVGDDWAGFRTSVSQIEAKTGYHFFERLRPEVAATLKQKVDTATIAPGSEGGGT